VLASLRFLETLCWPICLADVWRLRVLALLQMLAACNANDLPTEAVEVMGGGMMEWTQHRCVAEANSACLPVKISPHHSVITNKPISSLKAS
jgi:hypothetical protein